MRHKKREFPKDFGKKLGQAIAVRRKALKLTQDDLAGLVEVDAETISRFERGTSMPSIERLWAVADALGVGIGELLGGASKLSADQAAEMFAIFSDLDEGGRHLLLALAQVVREQRA